MLHNDEFNWSNKLNRDYKLINANNEKNTYLDSLKSALKAIVLNNLAIGILLGISFNLLKLEFSTHTEDL